MRRYDVLTGILLILSIIDFALAAPVLVQEKHQARVDAVNVLEKRWDEELEKLGEEYFKTGTHSSSSSAQPVPDHGSTNIVQPPVSNPPNPNPLTEPSCSSSTSSTRGLSARGNCVGFLKLFDAEWPEWPSNKRPDPSDSSSDYEPNSPSNSDTTSSSSSDWEYDRDYWKKPPWVKPDDPPPRPVPKLVLVRPPLKPPPKPLPPPKFDPLNFPSTSGHAPGPPPTESGSAEYSPLSGAASPMEHEMIPEPPTSQDLGHQLEHQSLIADPQLIDLQAATYAAKGKAKESRHISGTARDVGNAVQRESQPFERSLDPGE